MLLPLPPFLRPPPRYPPESSSSLPMRAHWQHFFPRDSVLHVWGGSPPLLSHGVQHQSDARPQWFRIAAFPVWQSTIWGFQACYPPGMRGAMWRHAYTKTMEITPWHAHIKNRFQLGGGRILSYIYGGFLTILLYADLSLYSCFLEASCKGTQYNGSTINFNSSSKGFHNRRSSATCMAPSEKKINK